MEPTAKEIAFALFDEGKLPSSKEVKALKIKAKTRYNYYQTWKNKQGLGSPADLETADEVPEGAEGDNSGKGSKRTPTPTTTPKRGGAAGGLIAVGKITITPENWGMDQHGAILILDTYNKTKRDIGYTGTVGDFLRDICEFYRRVLNYEEVEYARDTTDQGRGSPSEDGGQGAGQPLPLTAG